jgi:hypothetical protein
MHHNYSINSHINQGCFAQSLDQLNNLSSTSLYFFAFFFTKMPTAFPQLVRQQYLKGRDEYSAFLGICELLGLESKSQDEFNALLFHLQQNGVKSESAEATHLDVAKEVQCHYFVYRKQIATSSDMNHTTPMFINDRLCMYPDHNDDGNHLIVLDLFCNEQR